MSQVWYLHIVQSEISQESKIMNFCKRSYQPILRYFYTETIKHRGEISLHRQFELLVGHRPIPVSYNYSYYISKQYKCFKKIPLKIDQWYRHIQAEAR